MINRIVISLPYPTRVGFFIKKKVGFSFDNLSAFLMREEIECSTSADLQAWLKKNGENKLYLETLFAAAKAYKMHNVKRFNLDKKKFIQGLALLNEETSKKLVAAWTNSATYGGKDGLGKKKAMRS